MKLFVLSHSSYNKINLTLDHDGFLNLLEEYLSTVDGLTIFRENKTLIISFNTRRFSQHSLIVTLINLMLRNGFVDPTGKVVNSNCPETAKKYNLERISKNKYQINTNTELVCIELTHPPKLDSISVLDIPEWIYHSPGVSLELTVVNKLLVGFYGDKIGRHLQYIYSELENRIDYADQPLDECIKKQYIEFYIDSLTEDFCPLVEQLNSLLLSLGYVRDSTKLQQDSSDNLVHTIDSLGHESTRESLWNYNKVEIIYIPE